MMSRPEHTLIDLQQQIQSTLEMVRMNQGALGTSVQADVQEAPNGDVAMPNVTPPGPVPRLDELASRDSQIASELLHLQRTLSRQTFRGAESARRLVRRLVRKAELNAREIALLKGLRPGLEGGSAEDRTRLQLLLDEISHNLADLEKLGLSVGASPSTSAARSSSEGSHSNKQL
jgi:hypothetical protein